MCTAASTGRRLTSLEVGNRGCVSAILVYGDCSEAGGVLQMELATGVLCRGSKWSVCGRLHLAFFADSSANAREKS